MAGASLQHLWVLLPGSCNKLSWRFSGRGGQFLSPWPPHSVLIIQLCESPKPTLKGTRILRYIWLNTLASPPLTSQTKVRDATSNDPWGPSGTQMNEVAQMTYNQCVSVPLECEGSTDDTGVTLWKSWRWWTSDWMTRERTGGMCSRYVYCELGESYWYARHWHYWTTVCMPDLRTWSSISKITYTSSSKLSRRIQGQSW